MRTTALGVSGLALGLSLGSLGATVFAAGQPAGSERGQSTPLIPVSPQGKCAEAYFRAFNSGNEDAVREFEKTYRAPAALAETPLDERVKRYAGLRKEWGALKVKPGAVAGDRSLTLLVTCEGAGEDQLFEFQFDEGSKLKAIVIQGPVSADEAAALMEPVDRAGRARAVEELAVVLEEMYVFPEVGAKLAGMLRDKQSSGGYDTLTRAPDLARVLTEDLQAVCRDKHLRVRPGGMDAGGGRPPGGGAPGRPDSGFRKVERLAGNVGYIKFDAFNPSAEAQEVAGAAMAFVADCDALIFDVRENGGGSPVMIQFLTSYLFDSPTHLNSFYDRASDRSRETWTLETVPGKRFASDLPVYVLVSGRTFSAAEEFTYNLQCLKRATIVGQTTGGGAHPVRPRSVGERFTVTVPYARAVNPITKTNWEGVGVKPEIEVPVDNALDAALEDARQKIRRRADERAESGRP